MNEYLTVATFDPIYVNLLFKNVPPMCFNDTQVE